MTEMRVSADNSSSCVIYLKASAMTSNFPEVPRNFYFLIFYCEEILEVDPPPSPSKTAKIYAETNEPELPGTLNEFLIKLIASTSCEYTVRPLSWLRRYLLGDNGAPFSFTVLNQMFPWRTKLFQKHS